MAEGRRGRWKRGEHRRGYEQQRKGTLAICLSYMYIFLSPTCRLWRRNNDEDGTRGQHVNRQRKYVGYTTCLLLLFFLLLSLCCLPHAGYGGGTTTRKMVATTTAREDNMYIAEESTLAIPPVCCCCFFVVISLLSPTCWLWRRDNDKVDGGDDDQRDERTTSPKNVCWLYLLFFLGCYIFVLPHAGYGRGTTTRWMVVTMIKGTGGQHCRRTYVGYTTCLLFFLVVISLVSHMLAMAEGQ